MSAGATGPVATEVPATVPAGMTVIVPTLNRGGYLGDTLRDLVAQTHRPLEILVVDQSDTADPAVDALVNAHADLIGHHRVRFRGLPQARNYGWQHASFDYLLYLDDDIRCGPQLVSEHLRVLTQPGVGLVGGGTEEQGWPESHATPPRFDRWSASPRGGFGAFTESHADHAKGCNFSVRREAVARAGGVDEALSIGAALYEETDLALRISSLGYDIRFNGAARVRHLAAPSGGCRTDVVLDYVSALAHNRAVLIRRHSRAPQQPVACAHLAATAMAFAWHYRSPGCVPASWRGFVIGWRDGGHRPRCTATPRAHGMRA